MHPAQRKREQINEAIAMPEVVGVVAEFETGGRGVGAGDGNGWEPEGLAGLIGETAAG